MADIVTPEIRSWMMSGIKSKNTKPEIFIRSALHRMGYRFRIHASKLPGKPDIVLPKYNAIILVNGCFWHGHDCHLFKWPSTRKEFWCNKITGNKKKDQENYNLLQKEHWRILIIWECSLKGKAKLDYEDLIRKVAKWIESKNFKYEIRGKL